MIVIGKSDMSLICGCILCCRRHIFRAVRNIHTTLHFHNGLPPGAAAKLSRAIGFCRMTLTFLPLNLVMKYYLQYHLEICISQRCSVPHDIPILYGGLQQTPNDHISEKLVWSAYVTRFGDWLVELWF